MSRSARLSEKEAKDEAQREPEAKKSRSDDKISNISAMDNGTMMESFKFLNYCQLAKNSLASKKFYNLIRTHRHKLALLDVNEISVDRYVANRKATFIKLFNEEISPEDYNKWAVCNGYSKQIPLELQVVGKERYRHCCDIYEFHAYVYQNPNHATAVFYALAEFKNETWPLFQHFIRLLMDPFIYIRTMSLISQKTVLSLLAGAMDPNRNRLQCKQLKIEFNGNAQKFIIWIKDHVRCNEFEIDIDNGSNCDEELLDLILTGAPCTFAINIVNYYHSKVIVDLVQKFTALQNGDEYQVIASTRGSVKDRGIVAELKRSLTEFIAEEEQFEEDHGIRQVIGFINSNIEKKLTLSVKKSAYGIPSSAFSIKITHL